MHKKAKNSRAVTLAWASVWAPGCAPAQVAETDTEGRVFFPTTVLFQCMHMKGRKVCVAVGGGGWPEVGLSWGLR